MSLKLKKILGWMRTYAAIIAMVAATLRVPSVARADSLNGFMDWNYATSRSSATDSTGAITKGSSDSFSHRYSLNTQKTLYPNLSLTGGGLFDQQISKVTGEAGQFDSTLTKMSPYGGITLNNAFGNAGLNLYRREEKGSGSAATNVNETYNFNLGVREWKFLPPLNLLFTRTNSFDEDRVSQDLTTDSYSFGTKYRLFSTLDLTYQGAYTDATDRLHLMNFTTMTNSGRASYSRQFFDNRLSLATTYSITGQTSRTSGTGNGEVFLQVFPFAGLSAVSDMPQLVQMLDTPALVNGDLGAGSGINLGVPPLGGDSKPRNLGVDFVNPAQVDTLRIWVNQQLPAEISSRFAWEVYVSSDNLNWTLVQTLPSAPFGQFENRFELRIAPVTTRYLKVVTRPLPMGVPPLPGTDVGTIIVTEVQAFLSKPADAVKGRETASTSQLYTLGTRARLLADRPLYYDMNLTYNQSSTGDFSASRYVMSNALSYNHTFNRIFSGTARFGREDSHEAAGNRAAYIYTASLAAVPLPALNHTLVYSGTNESIAGKWKMTNAVFLNNNAELYRGVNVSLSGGFSTVSVDGGETSNNSTVSMGTILVPLSSVSININYSGTSSDVSGGGKAANSTFTQRGETSVAYNPVRSLYLFGALALSKERQKDIETTETFGGTWSPFRDGALQLNLAYSETLTSIANQKDRMISPTLRWNIRGGSFLMLSYTRTHSESTTQEADIDNVSAGLRFSF